jgi:hypothetical protein
MMRERRWTGTTFYGCEPRSDCVHEKGPFQGPFLSYVLIMFGVHMLLCAWDLSSHVLHSYSSWNLASAAQPLSVSEHMCSACLMLLQHFSNMTSSLPSFPKARYGRFPYLNYT